MSDDGQGTITLTCPDGSSASWTGTTTTESLPSGLGLFDTPIVTDGFSSSSAVATLTWVGGADLDLHAADGVPRSDHNHAYFGNPIVEGTAYLELLGDAPAMCPDEDHAVRSEAIIIRAGVPVDVFFWVDVGESCGLAVPEWTLTIESEDGERWSVVGNHDMATGQLPANLVEAPYLAMFGF